MVGLKILKPTSPGSRGIVRIDRQHLWKGAPFKSLLRGLSKTGGRNNLGRITTRHIGGGAKRRYRIIDFKMSKEGFYTVERLEYDPNRTAFVHLMKHESGSYHYFIAIEGVKVGNKLNVGKDADVISGNVLSLRNIPVGSAISCLEMKDGKGVQLVRSAGSFATLLGFEKNHAIVKLPSGEVRLFDDRCCASIGSISNRYNKNIKYGKAGIVRKLGTRPSVRGVVMNPVDHPHGGGEGRTSGGRCSVTPWGVITKGKKTRKKNSAIERYIVRRRDRK
ncbi:50S ribosomal protein L2 [Anaplasmataceae bacterium AB001_6]|nr:50S ribosomal protein L2 [Anaplasmataceae bacterium AB001_6]